MASERYIAIGQSGANGSFSYADTSRYGPKGLRSIDVITNQLIIPGAGGGGRPNPSAAYGGRTPGANPAGVVIIRIYKVE